MAADGATARRRRIASIAPGAARCASSSTTVGGIRRARLSSSSTDDAARDRTERGHADGGHDEPLSNDRRAVTDHDSRHVVSPLGPRAGHPESYRPRITLKLAGAANRARHGRGFVRLCAA